MMIRNGIFGAALVVACALPSAAAFAKDSGVTVRAGLAKRTAQGSFVVYRQTTNIRYVTKSVDPNYFFGVLATLPAADTVTCHAVVYLPEKQRPDKANGGLMMGRVKISGATYQTVTTPTQPADDCGIVLRLDDGDIPGDYIVKLFVGKKMAKKVVFHVRRK